ncbi:hypothetical protein [Leptothoe sp. PORK10 BA2]|uniref:hypothetical protein n=1 Tax=Leptothoe sp. PORK10 BA2 TaxID=3110254 RepID=UPI002B2098D1|nr:hypothetical protein [Leptothoe sp. PORK10 BA2]MEA5467029.1 hypothetical protein [Leptothoe sp. PORK10 BA2]
MGKQLKFWFLTTLTTLMVLAGSILQVGEPLMAAQTIGGTSTTSGTPAITIANQLYRQYPDIPRAPQANTTLLSRFIEYHLDTQARPAQYHFDWELSMANYLNIAYGSQPTAPAIASPTDKLAMQGLSRQQRHDLIRSLEERFAR